MELEFRHFNNLEGINLSSVNGGLFILIIVFVIDLIYLHLIFILRQILTIEYLNLILLQIRRNYSSPESVACFKDVQ